MSPYITPQAIVHISLAPKSNRSGAAYFAALAEVEDSDQGQENFLGSVYRGFDEPGSSADGESTDGGKGEGTARLER